jgi:hypothetical protein
MSNVLQNFPVMLYLRHICHISFPKWQIHFSISWVKNKPQENHHWIIVKHICHFASQMILYLGPLFQCRFVKSIPVPFHFGGVNGLFIDLWINWRIYLLFTLHLHYIQWAQQYEVLSKQKRKQRALYCMNCG